MEWTKDQQKEIDKLINDRLARANEKKELETKNNSSNNDEILKLKEENTKLREASIETNWKAYGTKHNLSDKNLKAQKDLFKNDVELAEASFDFYNKKEPNLYSDQDKNKISQEPSTNEELAKLEKEYKDKTTK